MHQKKLSYKQWGIVLIIPLIYLLLISSMFVFFDKNKMIEIMSSPRILHALKLSILCSTWAALFSVMMAIPVSYLLSRYNFLFKNFLDTIIELPLLISPAALGAMVLIFLSTRSGEYIQQYTGPIVYSVTGIVIVQLLSTVGIAIRLIKSVIEQIPARYEEVARTLGASPWQAFRTITLPLSKKGILASFILVWAKSIGEFGATITIAGAIPGKTETLPITIFLQLSSADIEGAVILIMLALLLGLTTLFLLRLLEQKKWF